MPPRDIVLTFFATPDKDAATMQPVSQFKSPPLVYPVPTSGSKGGFPTWALKVENGRTLPALLQQVKSKLGGDVPGRVCAVGFSAGRSGVQQLLNHPADRAAMDAVIDLDGLHFMRGTNGAAPEAQVSPWVEYGKLAADASHLLALLHTAIVPVNSNKIFSTTESNAILFDRITQVVGSSGQQQPWNQDDLVRGPPPPAVTVNNPIWGKNGKVVKYENVTYDAMPPMSIRMVGNAFSVAMPGTRPADHIFAANWGQRAMWQTFLAPRWNGWGGGGNASAFSFFGSLPGGVNTTYLVPNDYAEEGQSEDGSVSSFGKTLAVGGILGALYAAYRVWKK